MPLVRSIGSWALERGVDGPVTLAVLSTLLLPVLPLILSVGAAYELVRWLDFGHRLNSEVHWALAVALVGLLVLAIAVLFFG